MKKLFALLLALTMILSYSRLAWLVLKPSNVTLLLSVAEVPA